MRHAPKKLTDLGVAALKPAAKGERDEHPDMLVRGLVVRVSDKGRKSFALVARFPGSPNPTRRTIAGYPEMSLKAAREEANSWLLMLDRGIDPRDAVREEKERRALERNNSFQSVAEDYLKDIPSRQRSRHADKDAAEIRRELLDPKRNTWLNKPMAQVTDGDIGRLVAAVRDRPAPGMAYNTLGHIKAIFSWAMWPERRAGYGLSTNIAQGLQPKHFKLAKTVSTRVLSDLEIRAYWRAAEKLPYPLGPFFKLLLLTGQRKSEVSDARWTEFDLSERRLWTVPEERFKSGQSHLVPLSSDAAGLLNSLPRFTGDGAGQHVFSTTNGLKPINGFGRAKMALDQAMLEILKKEDEAATLPDWVLHDVRRTVRTRLSALRVNSEVAEMVIGHGKTGLRRVYDQHQFEPEMREALERWSVALKLIVDPPQSQNVLPFVAPATG